MIDAKLLLDDIEEQSTEASQWEAALDYLGPTASYSVLLSHLQKAPADAPSKQYLSDYISTLELTNKRN